MKLNKYFDKHFFKIVSFVFIILNLSVLKKLLLHVDFTIKISIGDLLSIIGGYLSFLSVILINLFLYIDKTNNDTEVNKSSSNFLTKELYKSYDSLRAFSKGKDIKNVYIYDDWYPLFSNFSKFKSYYKKDYFEFITNFYQTIHEINELLSFGDYDRAEKEANKYFTNEIYNQNGFMIPLVNLNINQIANGEIKNKTDEEYVFWNKSEVIKYSNQKSEQMSKIIEPYIINHLNKNNIIFINLKEIEKDLVDLLEKSHIELDFLRDELGRKGKYVLAIKSALLYLEHHSKTISFIWNEISFRNL